MRCLPSAAAAVSACLDPTNQSQRSRHNQSRRTNRLAQAPSPPRQTAAASCGRVSWCVSARSHAWCRVSVSIKCERCVSLAESTHPRACTPKQPSRQREVAPGAHMASASARSGASQASPLVKQLQRQRPGTSRSVLRSARSVASRPGTADGRSLLQRSARSGTLSRGPAHPLVSPIATKHGNPREARAGLSRKLFANYHRMQDVFHSADPGGRGVVSYKDFKRALRAAGVKMPQQVRAVFVCAHRIGTSFSLTRVHVTPRSSFVCCGCMIPRIAAMSTTTTSTSGLASCSARPSLGKSLLPRSVSRNGWAGYRRGHHRRPPLPAD